MSTELRISYELPENVENMSIEGGGIVSLKGNILTFQKRPRYFNVNGVDIVARKVPSEGAGKRGRKPKQQI